MCIVYYTLSVLSTKNLIKKSRVLVLDINLPIFLVKHCQHYVKYKKNTIGTPRKSAPLVKVNSIYI